MKNILAPALLATSMLLPTTSLQASEDQWQARIALYGWATNVDTRVSHHGLPTLEIDRGFSDILKSVDMAGMGLLETHKGNYGILIDGIYVNMKDTASGPFGIRANLEMDLATTMLAGQYRFHQTPENYADLIVGLRGWYVKTDIAVTTPITPELTDKRSKQWVDLMMGAKGVHDLNQNWFASWSAMVGGFGLSSEWVNDLHVGVGYRLTEQSAIQLGYRYMDVDYNQGRFDVKAELSGLLVGIDYRF